jgi:hypothetical protein
MIGTAAYGRSSLRCDDSALDMEGTDSGFPLDSISNSKKLRTPGLYDSWEGEVRRVTQVHAHKGLKMELAKQITPFFGLRHSVQLGDSPSNPNAQEHYSLMATLGSDIGYILSTLDQNGSIK